MQVKLHESTMPGVRVPASFYRGGTSKGLLLRAADLAPYAPATRDAIVCTAMGSPDPDGRQIDGLGGGASSLSKVALVSKPGQGLYTRLLAKLGGNWKLPGVAWADDVRRAHDPEDGWDVVYRFGQVPIRGTEVDWKSTCGNLLAAVGLYAMQNKLLDTAAIQRAAEERGATDAFPMPIRILMAGTGKRATVSVPMRRNARSKGTWELSTDEDTSIAGVPGKAPGIQVAVPLDATFLPTGNVCDSITVGDKPVRVSIIDAGLPTVFVHAADLDVNEAQLVKTAAELDTDTLLHAKIEAVRQAAAQCTPALQQALCSSAPKVVLVHPRTTYTMSGGDAVRAEDMDLLVRPVSVGQFHRSIMATALSALSVGAAYPESIIGEALAQGGAATSPCASTKKAVLNDAQRAITVGQPAGTSTATVELKNGTPTSIVYDRTARRIIEGNLDIPPRVAQRWAREYAALFEQHKNK